MNEVFMVHISLPEVFTAEIYQLLPEQRVLVSSLMEKRVILSYSLDMERKNIWAFLEARDEKHLKSILATFPIIAHVGIKIHELAYHDAAPVSLPDLIMN
jgi:hypothetical protein